MYLFAVLNFVSDQKKRGKKQKTKTKRKQIILKPCIRRGSVS